MQSKISAGSRPSKFVMLREKSEVDGDECAVKKQVEKSQFQNRLNKNRKKKGKKKDNIKIAIDHKLQQDVSGAIYRICSMPCTFTVIVYMMCCQCGSVQ